MMFTCTLVRLKEFPKISCLQNSIVQERPWGKNHHQPILWDNEIQWEKKIIMYE